MQFLVESIFLTLLGGIIGVLCGVFGAYIVSYFANWPSLVSFQMIFVSLIFSMILGVFFGLVPANKAANQPPIEALRE